MNDLRHDPDAIDPVAERTAYLRQWQPIPPGVQPWGRTVMHTPDGGVYTNVDPPEPEPPDLRTVGDRVAELEGRLTHVEALLHRLLNPGEQEGGNDLNDIAARLQRLESMFQSLMYAGMALAETDEERCKVMAAYSVHQAFHGPGEQEGE
jgi:hypothetical protein